MAEDKVDFRQLTIKVPTVWHSELVKIAGTEMAHTGKEVTLTELITRSLDKSYELKKKTGKCSDGTNGTGSN